MRAQYQQNQALKKNNKKLISFIALALATVGLSAYLKQKWIDVKK